MKGNNPSKETRLRLSLSQPYKGKKRPKEIGEKVSKALMGRKLSESHKKSLAKGQQKRVQSPNYVHPMLGKKQSKEAIEKASLVNSKPVIQYDLKTGERIAEYVSITKAATLLGCKSGNHLIEHLKGKRSNFKGFRFEYKNKTL